VAKRDEGRISWNKGSAFPTVREAIAAAVDRLAAVSETPRLDAELLMAESLGVEREAMLLSPMSGPAPQSFAALVTRRQAGEPAAYILGRRAFWTIDLEVGPDVLIPRPDSETLLEAALAHFGERSPATVLDLGTGSGALLLAALDQWPNARGLGVDSSTAALAIARRNAARLGLDDRCAWRDGDWAAGIEDRFDLILCNPPYIADGAALPREVSDWEPHAALFAGADGLDAIRRLAPMIPGLLKPGAIACVEIGADQRDAATRLFAAEGLEAAGRKDLGGHVRCLALRC
jgi:release factor glutamine methyltransferase